MRVSRCVALVATIFLLSGAANADLNTLSYISVETADGNVDGGSGRVDLDGTKGQILFPGDTVAADVSVASQIAIFDQAGGDMWNGGDQFTYLYDSNKVTGDFTATVRVVAQSESVDGRWGKAGIRASANLTGLSQYAMTQVFPGIGTQATAPDPALEEHSAVPVRINGRTAADGQGGFELPVLDSSGAEVPHNTFPEVVPGIVNPTTNVSWLRLQYKAESNTFVGGYAADVDGAPGEWGYTTNVTTVPLPTADDGDGWFVGIGYSAHNSFVDLADEDDMHGVIYDNYSIVNEFLPKEVSVGGQGGFGVATVSGTQSGLIFGETTQVEGLAQYWFAGNMRPGDANGGPEAYLAVGTEGNDTYPLMNPGGTALVTDTTWFSGSQGNPVTNADLPTYPSEITGSLLWGNGDNYGVKFVGQVFISEDGEYLLRDGIDDFTMVAIDQDGNGELDSLADLVNGDESPNGSPTGLVGNGFPEGDVLILDDDWANIDGSDQTADFQAIADIQNIPAGGEWRDIEIWVGEAGGGDGAILYMGNIDDPEIFDENDGAALSQEARDKFAIKQENLRTDITPIVGGEADASLASDALYILEAGPDGADQIVVDDADGFLVTTLDVSGANIRVDALEGLADGTEVRLFDADAITGTDALNISADGFDLSRIGEGIIVFGSAVAGCDPNTSGDIDGDGTVGFSDFLILSANFGNAAPGAGHSLGDIDCGGDVGFSDFLILSANFGNTVGAEASSVPEPSGFALLTLAGLLAGLVRKRR